MGFIRGLVQLKILIGSLFGKYFRIVKNTLKLLFYSLRAVVLSVNYLAALILIPGAVFFIAYYITRDYLVPSLTAAGVAIVYIIVMSNYFGRGVHKFSADAGKVKELYKSVKTEHNSIKNSIKNDPASRHLLFSTALLIVVEFILFYQLYQMKWFSKKILEILLVFVVLQIALVLVEYILSGYRLFALPRIRKQKDSKEKGREEKKKGQGEDKPGKSGGGEGGKKPSSEGFDDIIAVAEEEPEETKS